MTIRVTLKFGPAFSYPHVERMSLVHVVLIAEFRQIGVEWDHRIRCAKVERVCRTLRKSEFGKTCRNEQQQLTVNSPIDFPDFPRGME
jgi:hypothetical protein